MKAIEESTWGEFDSLEALASAELRDGRFCVTLDGGRFDAWFKHQPGRHLWVMLSAARDPARSRLPKFDRWSWASMFPGPVLCISDPTLYLDTQHLRIGWYVGTAEADWQGALAMLVQALARRLGFETRQVITYGSSAGGFGSLMLAARLGDATAVAINPQSDVLRYAPAAVTRLLGLAFGGRSANELTASERLRLSALRRYAQTPSVRCLYVQNRQDRTHFVHHFAPFARETLLPLSGGADHSGHLCALMYDDARGHAPEPREMAPSLIAHACRLADATLVQRPLGVPPLSIDHSPLERAFTPRQIGLGRQRPNELAQTTTKDVETLINVDPGWRFLDKALAQVSSAVRPDSLAMGMGAVNLWMDAALGTRLPTAAWDRPAPALRSLRLAMLLSLQRAGWPLWPKTRDAALNAVFEAHLRHLLQRAADPDQPPNPLELHAIAALSRHLHESPVRAWAEDQWRLALDNALRLRFTVDGMADTQTPAQLQAVLRTWQRCLMSGWFDQTGLPALLARAGDVQQWLRWPDGRPLPLGLAPAQRPTGSSDSCAFKAQQELRSIGGHVISRDDGGGEVRRASLLHLMAAQRTRGVTHDDGLAVLWFEGSEILTDPGHASGIGSPLSTHLQSSAAHNTVSPHRGRATTSRTAHSELLDTMSLAGRAHISARRSNRGATWQHVRHVVHAPGAWLLLVDMLESRSALDWARWLHFGPAVEPVDDGGARWRLPDGRSLTMHTSATTAHTCTRIRGQASPQAQGWLATDQGVVPGWAVGHTVTGSRCVLATWLVLDDEGSALALDGDKALKLRLARDGTLSTLRLGWTANRCRFDAVSLGLK